MVHGDMIDKTLTKLRSLWSRNVLEISYDSHISHNCVQASYDNLLVMSFIS